MNQIHWRRIAVALLVLATVNAESTSRSVNWKNRPRFAFRSPWRRRNHENKKPSPSRTLQDRQQNSTRKFEDDQNDSDSPGKIPHETSSSTLTLPAGISLLLKNFSITTAIRWSLIGLLSREIWKASSEIWRELNEASDMKDDFSSTLVHSRTMMAFTHSQVKRVINEFIKSPAMNENGEIFDETLSATVQGDRNLLRLCRLALLLRLTTGLPYQSIRETTSVSMLTGSPSSSVESILLSLTLPEVRLLEQALYDPRMDDEELESIVGLDFVKEDLLDYFLHKQGSTADNKDAYGIVDPYAKLLSRSRNGGGNCGGILLYGPPGCGKTSIIKGLAKTRLVGPLLLVTPSLLLSKYVGETNRNVRTLFSLASKLGPKCLLCLDEADGLLPARRPEASQNSWVAEFTTEFLQWWDGMLRSGTGSRNSSITIIATSNRPFDLDLGALRRLSQCYFIGLPREEDRFKILARLIADIPHYDLDLGDLVESTVGFEPSQLHQLVATAIHLGPLRESRTHHSPTCPAKYRPLRQEDLQMARQKVGMTFVSQEYCRRLEVFRLSRQGTLSSSGEGMESSLRMPHSYRNQEDQSSVQPFLLARDTLHIGKAASYGGATFAAETYDLGIVEVEEGATNAEDDEDDEQSLNSTEITDEDEDQDDYSDDDTEFDTDDDL